LIILHNSKKTNINCKQLKHLETKIAPKIIVTSHTRQTT